MTLIVFYGVLLQYVAAAQTGSSKFSLLIAFIFNMPMSWAEELSRFLFVWGCRTLDGRWDTNDTRDAANVADLVSQGKCLF